jgi:hypothetical protein
MYRSGRKEGLSGVSRVCHRTILGFILNRINISEVCIYNISGGTIADWRGPSINVEWA